ncbi:unnamed protein product [Linum tenue]|uniref:Phospholipase/carboxylesterase/thioesterase domain-containing protein n=1 Tax=Linum tenue TaxID=586396 RepID=A0AAV0HWH2_9ROSI|nr:unnamed protein product [Linum tenue]
MIRRPRREPPVVLNFGVDLLLSGPFYPFTAWWMWVFEIRFWQCGGKEMESMEARIRLGFVLLGIIGSVLLLSNMSFTGPSMASARRAFDFGKTYVVRPKGKHQATVVWLHGLGDNGSSWSQLLEALPLPNIKWICPTAPTRPVTLFGGFPSTAWFDVEELSEDAPDDLEGLDAAATHVANLLSTEPADIKIGIGGFSMGSATALYSGTCFSVGKYANGNPFTANLSAVVGLSGWLPCAKTLGKQLEGADGAADRAASLPTLLCHGKADDVVSHKYGEKSSRVLTSLGFKDVTFKSYNSLGHYTIPQEMDEVCAWLSSKLGLDTSSSSK